MRDEEHKEQVKFIQWTKRMGKMYPRFNMIFAIPNGGARHISVASKLKLEGVKAGIPDLMFPVASRGYHGLFIEMKRLKGGVVSGKQKAWKVDLEREGYAWKRANGFLHAKKIILGYMKMEEPKFDFQKQCQ